MTLTTRAAGAAVGMVAVAAMALAASTVSAQAAPPLLNGTYSDGDDANMWTIATTCAPAGCAGTVASNQGWVSPMTLTEGRWYFAVTKPDGFICSDGRYEPAVISMMIDPVTLGGIVSADSNGACPGGIVSATPFQLKAR